MFRKNSGIENFQAKEGGSFTVLSKIILSYRTEKNSPGTHSVFQKISGREKYFMDKRGWVSRFSVENFLSHWTEIFHWRTLRCFRKIPLSKIFMHRKGGITVLSNFFEKLCKGTLLFSGKFLVSKKNLWIRGSISQFSVEAFMSHSDENFRERILLFLRKFGVSKNFMHNKSITFFRRKFFFSQCRKISRASLQCFRKFGVSKNFMHNNSITFFGRKFLVSHCRKISWASLQCFRKFGVSKNFMQNKSITFFRRKFLVSQCRKTLWRNPLVFH